MAAPAILAARLAATLDGIWASALPVGEKRRLGARAAAAGLFGPTPASDEGEEANPLLYTYEELLSAVGTLAGVDKPGISQAKHILRQHGDHGHRLASRLGRVSKLRNGKAHPDVSLLREVAALGAGHLSASDEHEPENEADAVDEWQRLPGQPSDISMAVDGVDTVEMSDKERSAAAHAAAGSLLLGCSVEQATFLPLAETAFEHELAAGMQGKPGKGPSQPRKAGAGTAATGRAAPKVKETPLHWN